MTNQGYRVGHRVSDHDFGVFIVASPEADLDFMAAQAGYRPQANIPSEQKASDEDLFVENVDGTVHDLAQQLIAAGEKLREEEDAEGVPDALYVQHYRDCRWIAHFSETHDRETEMTRMSTGEDIAGLYAAIAAGNCDAVFEYASTICGGSSSSLPLPEGHHETY